MFNDMNVKNSWESLRCKFQLQQITKSREKVLQPIETAFWEKFKNLSFNPLQNSILEQVKEDHEIGQIWFPTRKKK